jgi:hypothetical protein
VIEAPPITINALLHASGVQPKDVLLFRHRPGEPHLNRIFDRIVAERRDLFDCYQGTHGPRTETALQKAKYLASFIRHRAGTALFVGFYELAHAFDASPGLSVSPTPPGADVSRNDWLQGYRWTRQRDRV